VKELTSRARNLALQMNDWANRMNRWCQSAGFSGIAQALRLGVRHTPVRAVYLFGISFAVARVTGYGADQPDSILAMVNWPQLLRLRHQIGPAPHLFRELHQAILQEHRQALNMKDVPFTVKAADISVRFENLWQVTADSAQSSADHT
jgi:hypothetical protein